MSGLPSDALPSQPSPALFSIGDRGRAGAGIRSPPGLLDLLPADAHADDAFDEALERAVRAFQQQRGLNVDGVVGTSTYRALEEARWRLGDRLLTQVPGNLLAGDDVLALQQRLLDLG